MSGINRNSFFSERILFPNAYNKKKEFILYNTYPPFRIVFHLRKLHYFLSNILPPLNSHNKINDKRNKITIQIIPKKKKIQAKRRLINKICDKY